MARRLWRTADAEGGGGRLRRAVAEACAVAGGGSGMSGLVVSMRWTAPREEHQVVEVALGGGELGARHEVPLRRGHRPLRRVVGGS